MKKAKKAFAFLLASVLAVGSMSATAMAETGTKPEDGTTIGQPFPSGTGGSQNFRIPGLVTLNDGTLVAACDARWNHGGDACGLDTIVSRSTDNGANWSYTFANYLGDNGNQYHANSTAFIDPAITSDGETLYLIADVWPGGYAINTAPNAPVAGQNGHDEDGNLRLSGDGRSTYGYHLEKNTEGSESYYVIKDNATGAAVEGYTVDAYFNITGDGYEGNLFYSDSPYLVYPTDYLYLTTSKDGGATWSIPSLIDVKKEDEQSFLVGPGRGLATSTGRIIFTAYEWTRSKGGDVSSACFYSDDQGVTWTRGESVSSQSSEAAIVEADGKLYMFTRHGGYYVSEDWGETWSEKKTTGITYNHGCQLSAITYSKKIDGKTAIILSAPSNTSSRAAGKFFVGLVQSDGTISWDYSYSVNGSAYYAYSCLTELNDGSIGLLYENAGTAITYENIPVTEIAQNGVIGNIWCEDADGNVAADVDMKSNASVTLDIQGADGDAVLTASSDNEELLKVSLAGNKLTITSGAVASGLVRGTVTVTDGNDTVQLTVNVTDAEQFEIVELRMGDIKTYPAADVDVSSLDTAIANVTAGSDEMTIEGITEGTTSVKVGDTEYFIIVKNDVKEIKLEEGESLVVKGAAIQQPADEKIVLVEKNEDRPPYAKVNGITGDGQYLIGSVSHIVIGDDSTVTDPVGRSMRAANFELEDLTEYMWIIKAEDGGYTIQSKDGRYLNFESATSSSCSVILSDIPQVLSIVAGSSDGYGITNGTHYLNNFSGSNVRAAGWNANDNNWYFYQTADSYVVTGTAEGSTTLIVGGTTYNITVGNPKPAEVEKALADLNQKLADVEALLEKSGTYTDASVKKLSDALKAAEALLADGDGQNLENITAALNALTEAANKLEVKQEDKNPVPVNPQPVTPQPSKPEVKLPAVGSVHADAKGSYKVTSSTEEGGTVVFVKPNKKTNKKFTVPASVKIDGLTYKVTEIAGSAFKANKKLAQVTVGANVTKIGKAAFANCKNLKKITIKSKSLKSVGKQAFKGINKKCVIKVPKQKKAAYKKLFKGKGLTATMKLK